MIINSQIEGMPGSDKLTFQLEDDYIFNVHHILGDKYLTLIFESIDERVLIPLPIKVLRLKEAQEATVEWNLKLSELIE